MTNAIAEFSKKIDDKLVEPLRQVNKGRTLVHTTDPQGFEISNVEWGKIIEMSEGMVSYSFTSGNKDQIDAQLTNSKIPVYWKEYEIDRRIFESWNARGTDIDAANAIAAGYAATKVEDFALINGVTRDGVNFDTPGLYQGAGVDYNVATSMVTFGKATDAISGCLNLMDDAGVPVDRLKWNWAMPSAAYHRARRIRNTQGVKELPDILDMLNGGELVSVGTVLATTQSVLVPDPAVGEPFVDYYLTADFQTDPKNPEYVKTGNIGGRVFSAGVLRIKQEAALGKISNLTYVA
jgi:uncharacterized linocin/CFP29 family protein